MSKRNNNIVFGIILSPVIIVLAFLLILLLFVSIAKEPKNDIENSKVYNYIQLEDEVKITTAYIDSLLSTLDKDKDNIFNDEDLYIDIIIYGDESYIKANDLETKIYMLKNVVESLNTHKNEVHASKNMKHKDVKKIFDYTNKEIKKTNILLEEYNKLNDTKIISIPTVDETILK